MKLKGKKVVGLSIIAIGVLISIAVVIRSRSADQKTTGTAGLHEASFYQMLEDGLVRCELCPNRCLLKEGERGLCKVRENIGGKLYNRRREPRVYPWVNPSKIFDEVARRFGGNLRFQSTTA